LDVQEFRLQAGIGMQPDSTTGLSSRTASVLSYLGWWVSGLIFWAIEREDALVRFHAAQATITFGGLALLIGVLGLLGLVMLSFAPSGFLFFAGAAFVVWIAGVVLWLIALWQAGQGKRWRIPLAAELADSWSRTSRTSSA
jgi:uncharacterized membrane protein